VGGKCQAPAADKTSEYVQPLLNS